MFHEIKRWMTVDHIAKNVFFIKICSRHYNKMQFICFLYDQTFKYLWKICVDIEFEVWDTSIDHEVKEMELIMGYLNLVL